MRSRKFPVIALLLALTTLIGCAAINKHMAAWVGQPESALIASMGPPTRTAPDALGGHILIFEQFIQTGHQPAEDKTTGNVDPGGNVNLTTTHTPERTYGYNRVRMFYVNESGIIYSWRWQGL